MRYDCGHSGCDICGYRVCDKSQRRMTEYKYAGVAYFVCEPCVSMSIKFAYDAACMFGGTVIDVARKCGAKYK